MKIKTHGIIGSVKYKEFFSNTEKLVLFENKKLALSMVERGLLSRDDYKTLEGFDKTPTKKYVGWMAKQWVVNKQKPQAEQFTPDELRNTIEEYNQFVENRSTDKKDIFQFKSFAELKQEVDRLNSMGRMSSTEMENDYEVIRDDNDVVIMCPHTHAASRKLGLSIFAYRECKESPSGKDSAWCTTYANHEHFNGYYYTHNITFYYIKIKSDQIMNKIKEVFSKKFPSLDSDPFKVVAVAVYPNNDQREGYDGKDKKMDDDVLNEYLKIVGIDSDEIESNPDAQI
jgi:hypothetical protein